MNMWEVWEVERFGGTLSNGEQGAFPKSECSACHPDELSWTSP